MRDQLDALSFLTETERLLPWSDLTELQADAVRAAVRHRARYGTTKQTA